jgi:hypothetical protein
MTQLDSYNAQAKYRTSRMFMDKGSWFFKTREGDTIGPFQEELEASTQLEVYIRLVNSGLLPLQEVMRPTPTLKKKVG